MRASGAETIATAAYAAVDRRAAPTLSNISAACACGQYPPQRDDDAQAACLAGNRWHLCYTA